MGVPKNLSSAAIMAVAAAAAFFLFGGKGFASFGHDFTERDCLPCHRDAIPGKLLELRAPDADVSAECEKCHRPCYHWARHRNTSQTLTAMGQVMPLSGESRIVCVTCHDPHDSRTTEGRYLRISNLKRELCLNCHQRFGGIKRASLNVLTPPVDIVTFDDYIPLIGRTFDMTEGQLLVTVNGNSFPISVKEGVFDTQLRLQEGMNWIILGTEERGLWQTEVFLVSASIQGDRFDRIFSRHQTTSQEECAGCHGSSRRMRISEFENSAILCYRCHEPYGEKRFLHGPLAVGACMSCHNPHGGLGSAFLKEEVVPLCFSCHSAGVLRKNHASVKAFTEKSCAECHDPHQSDNRYLVKPVSDPRVP